MRDSTYIDPITKTIPNDGDDIQKALQAEENGLPTVVKPQYPPASAGAAGAPYTGEGVSWYAIDEASSNSTGPVILLPPDINALLIDPQGRLLIGTNQGIWRGTPLGFGYDWDTASPNSVLAQAQGFTALKVPGMAINDLNGNLQDLDVTAVAVDPTDPSRMYISATFVGTATTESGLTGWQTIGQTGPTIPLGGGINLGIPNASQVLTATPTPGASADTPATLYRTWQFFGSDSLIPEVSIDAGVTFISNISQGISATDTAGLAPIIAINPVQVPNNGQYFNELLFGTNKVYLTKTGGNVWDAISGDLDGDVSALAAVSPNMTNEFLAGTNAGQVYLDQPGATGFTNITEGSLTTLVRSAVQHQRDHGRHPTNPTTAFVMLAVPDGKTSVYYTTDLHAGFHSSPGAPRHQRAAHPVSLVHDGLQPPGHPRSTRRAALPGH